MSCLLVSICIPSNGCVLYSTCSAYYHSTPHGTVEVYRQLTRSDSGHFLHFPVAVHYQFQSVHEHIPQNLGSNDRVTHSWRNSYQHRLTFRCSSSRSGAQVEMWTLVQRHTWLWQKLPEQLKHPTIPTSYHAFDRYPMELIKRLLIPYFYCGGIHQLIPDSMHLPTSCQTMNVSLLLGYTHL